MMLVFKITMRRLPMTVWRPHGCSYFRPGDPLAPRYTDDGIDDSVNGGTEEANSL